MINHGAPVRELFFYGGHGMKILLTGGAGFIGSHVADAYIKAGHKVVILDNLSTGKRENINSDAKFYLCDVRQKELMEKVFKKEKFDLVNHHAAQMSVPYSVIAPQEDASINVLGFLNILELSVKYKIKKVIFISSGGAIYGEASEYPTPETYPPVPLSPYAITKFVSEQYLYYYHKQFRLDYTVLRYANVYGPRQIPHGEAGVISIFMTRLIAGQRCTIFAYQDEPEGMKRDYVFVEDVKEANIIALKKGSLAAFNIGTGTPTSTRKLYDIVFSELKDKVKISPKLKSPLNDKERPGDIRRSCLNVAKAKKILSWKAKYDIKKGINNTALWQIKEGQKSQNFKR
jgi:UDP-glucose 4-epimerase